MRKILVIYMCLLSAFAAAADPSSLFAPGVIVLWQDGTGTPIPGISVKNYAVANDPAISLSTFEIKVAYDPQEETSRLDATWPALYGFLSPGVSIETGPDGTVPWVLMELDLFYFPSLFTAIILFEKPLFVPSPFFNVRVGSEGAAFDAGIRVSFPLYPRQTAGTH